MGRRRSCCGTVVFVTSNSTSRPLSVAQPPASAPPIPHPRARIVAALAAETSERGYRAVTVADVVKRAGIDGKTFYENFSSREECLLATQEFAVNTALERVVEAAGRADGWPQQITAGLTAFLDYVVEEPALARTWMVESLTAGSAPSRSHEESLQAFASLFKLGRGVSSRAKDLPEALEEAIVGGIFWIVSRALAGSPADDIETLLPELIEFALTPYVEGEAGREVSLSQRTGQAASNRWNRSDRYRRFP